VSTFIAVVCAICLIAERDVSSTSSLIKVTRAEMLATARAMAEHRWVVGAAHLKAPCVRTYRTRWKLDQVVFGVPYDWGGMDNPAAFDKKLKSGQAAGSHQDEGVSPCTTGVDCSGFLSICWRQKEKFGTAAIAKIAPTLEKADLLTDLKPGDALNQPGVHIVMFAGYNADGTLNVYEAAGSASRVVLSTNNKRARFTKYVAIRYAGTVD
jgi:hypothetical protein